VERRYSDLSRSGEPANDVHSGCPTKNSGLDVVFHLEPATLVLGTSRLRQAFCLRSDVTVREALEGIRRLSAERAFSFESLLWWREEGPAAPLAMLTILPRAPEDILPWTRAVSATLRRPPGGSSPARLLRFCNIAAAKEIADEVCIQGGLGVVLHLEPATLDFCSLFRCARTVEKYLPYSAPQLRAFSFESLLWWREGPAAPLATRTLQRRHQRRHEWALHFWAWNASK
jgi:hypothetical protein